MSYSQAFVETFHFPRVGLRSFLIFLTLDLYIILKEFHFLGPPNLP